MNTIASCVPYFFLLEFCDGKFSPHSKYVAFYSHDSRSKWKKSSYSDIDIMTSSKISSIRISTSKQRRFQAGIFFHKIKSELFMRFNTVYMAYITYLIIQICFQNVMSLKRIAFQWQRKNFLKNHKNLAVFSHICLKASTFTDKRQKSGKKSFCYSEVILGFTIL